MAIKDKRKSRDEDASVRSDRPPKIPKTLKEKNEAGRLIVVLDLACLETVKVCANNVRAVQLSSPC